MLKKGGLKEKGKKEKAKIMRSLKSLNKQDY